MITAVNSMGCVVEFDTLVAAADWIARQPFPREWRITDRRVTDCGWS